MISGSVHERSCGIFSRYGAIAIMLVSCIIRISAAQDQKANLPDPIKFPNKFDVVMNAAREVLRDSYDIELDDRKGGRITTRPYEFVTGSLTSSELEKVAINKYADSGHWIKARYSVEAIFEMVSSVETLVTIRTDMEALNRAVDGTEKWLPVESRGIYERRILGKISAILMGKTKPTEKEGFWGQSPQPVDPSRSRFPTPP